MRSFGLIPVITVDLDQFTAQAGITLGKDIDQVALALNRNRQVKEIGTCRDIALVERLDLLTLDIEDIQRAISAARSVDQEANLVLERIGYRLHGYGSLDFSGSEIVDTAGFSSSNRFGYSA